MDINISYDSSVADAPAWFQSAVTTAVGQMDALIANPITLNLTFSWGEENNNAIRAGAAAQNQSAGSYMDYATLYGALASHATSADDKTAVAALSPTNPTGSGQFYVPLAMQKALGLDTASATQTDGYVGLDSTLNWSPSANGQVSTGQYDPVASLEHEMSEVMGRVGYLSGSQTPGIYGPMDLFRYTAAGQRDLTPGSGYFSIDGQTMEKAFNNPLLGGDAADWAASTIGDTFGNITAGVASNLSAADLQILDVLGYTIGTPPAPVAAAVPVAASAPATPDVVTTHDQSAASGDSRTIQAGYDLMRWGSGMSDTFVFHGHPGHSTIVNFATFGADHDVLSFSTATFSSVAEVLRNTRQVGNDAVIRLDPHETITLHNITVAALWHDPGDFSFHA